MVKVNVEQFTKKWGDRLTGATEQITNGVNNVSTAPGVMAAKKQEKMRAGINRALDSGKWAKNVAAVPLADWKNAILTKGLQRLSSGVEGAKPKVAAFAGKLLPYLDGLQKTVGAMPDLTLQDNINRMVKHVTEMSKFSK